VESQISLEAVIVAICHLLALANGFEDALVIAPLAESDFLIFIFEIFKHEFGVTSRFEFNHNARAL
jgi:hypothetical protein